MGIKDLNTFLLKQSPNCFGNLSISLLSGYAIAVDSSLLLYTYLATAHKNYVLKVADPLENINKALILESLKERLFSFIQTLLTYNITPVWIWDGVAVEDKIKAHERRKKPKESLSEKIKVLKDELSTMHPLARDIKKVTELRKLLSQQCYLSNEEKDQFRDLLSSLGFPCFTAESEAEALCSSLAREGKVVGVWSTDTDNFPLGTPMMITEFNGKGADGHPSLNVSFPPVALDSLNYTKEEFIDFCIMLECDFNERMTGIGPVKSQKLIDQYRKIDNIIPNKPDLPFDNLNYINCRKYFEHLPSNIASSELKFNSKATLLKSYPTLIKLCSNLTPPKQVNFY